MIDESLTNLLLRAHNPIDRLSPNVFDDRATAIKALHPECAGEVAAAERMTSPTDVKLGHLMLDFTLREQVGKYGNINSRPAR